MTGKLEGLSPKLLAILDTIEAISKVSVHVSSGKRTPAENKAAKGSPNSAHLRGLAADIRATDVVTAAKIVAAAHLAGIRRIGIYNTHVHIDIDKSLPTPAAWDFSTNRRQLHFVASYLVQLDRP